MAGLAPIHLKQKLLSPKERARVAALHHAAAHGAAARLLAARVAAMLDDPSETVQWHAVNTFHAIAQGAADAVPVLIALRAKGGLMAGEQTPAQPGDLSVIS